MTQRRVAIGLIAKPRAIWRLESYCKNDDIVIRAIPNRERLRFLKLEDIKQICDIFDQNPITGFDARERVIYPLLDLVYREKTPFEVTLRNGVRLRYEHKGKISKEIMLRSAENPSHIWEPMTTQAIVMAISYRRGSVLIGGAYFGDQAIIAANEIRRLGRSDSVICVEPNPENLALLLENAKENHVLRQIQPSGLVLWSEAGLTFQLDDRDSHAAANPASSGPLTSVTIDELFQTDDVTTPSLIVLDIEGSEEQALRGANSTLALPATDAPIVIAEIHRDYVNWDNGLRKTPIIQLLLEHDYVVYALRDHQGNWELDLKYPEIIPIDRVVLDGPSHGFNIIASKDPRFFDPDRFVEVTNVSPKYLRHRDPALYGPIQLQETGSL